MKATLYNTDCLPFLKTLPSASVDLVVTDPPYDLKVKGGGSIMKSTTRFQYLTKGELKPISTGFSSEVLDELVRVLKRVNLYLWCNKKQIPFLLDYFVTNRRCNFDLLTWHKPNPVPATFNKYLTDTEYLLFFRDKGVPVFGTFETKKTYYLQPYERNLKRLYKHPAIKPLNILKNLVINSSKEGDVVLDPYAGTGSTGVVCRELGRDFIGCEIDPEYYQIMCDRVGV